MWCDDFHITWWMLPVDVSITAFVRKALENRGSRNQFALYGVVPKGGIQELMHWQPPNSLQLQRKLGTLGMSNSLNCSERKCKWETDVLPLLVLTRWRAAQVKTSTIPTEMFTRQIRQNLKSATVKLTNAPKSRFDFEVGHSDGRLGIVQQTYRVPCR